jgi:hypothetical protein
MSKMFSVGTFIVLKNILNQRITVQEYITNVL